MRGRAAWGLLCAVLAPGCGNDDDACKGRTETCLSLTLSGSDGVSQADQLQVLLMRMPKPLSPMMRLSRPQDLPFKVAVLWPDGAAVVSVHSFLNGALNGVSPELTMELRGGEHAKRSLSLYPPLPGQGQDLGPAPPSDLRVEPDLSEAPDLITPPDLSETPDLSQTSDMAHNPDLGPPDLSGPPDMGTTPDMAPADLSAGPG